MYWNRRRTVAGSSVAALGLAALFAWWLVGHQPGSVAYDPNRPTSVLTPTFTASYQSAGGRPLTTVVMHQELLVVPRALPAWARKKLVAAVGPGSLRPRQWIWTTGGPLWHAWGRMAIPGIYRIEVRQIEPVSGVSRNLLEAWAKTAHQWARPRYRLSQAVWSLPSVKTVRLSLRLGLTKDLANQVPAGGSVVVLRGTGQMLAEVSSPLNRAIFWQPHPVGLGLVPPLLVQAMDSPKIFSGLSAGSGTALLGTVADRWGAASISRALSRIGIKPGRVLPGQPVLNPRAPNPSAAVLTSGQSLWATPLELARAYLLFVHKGLVPSVTMQNRVVSKPVRGVPVVASSTSLQTVDKLMPQIMTNGLAFQVWRPDGNFAVAYTLSKNGTVVVAEGSASGNIVQIVHSVGLWQMRSQH